MNVGARSKVTGFFTLWFYWLSILWLVGPVQAGLTSLKNGEQAEFDRRAFEKVTVPTSAAAQEQQLRDEVPGVRVDRHALTGSPQWIASTSGFLTGPELVPLATVPGQTGDPHRVVKAFVEVHRDLFGHGADLLSQARILRDAVTSHNGLR